MLLQFAWQQDTTYPKQRTLAERIGVSVRQAQRYLAELKDAAYIEIQREDKRFHNTYVIKRVRSKLRTGKRFPG
jgi:DNA-binding transcriptional regulator LsrR (DeoR family)